MVDSPGDTDSSFGFLSHKLGPLPVWAWALIAVGAWYWYTHYGPGATGNAAATPKKPAIHVSVKQGNTIKPALGRYKNNKEWEQAALNYLTGESIPPLQASTALSKYLRSKPLTSKEQSDVNLAIRGIGAPPTIPQPAHYHKPAPHRHLKTSNQHKG